MAALRWIVATLGLALAVLLVAGCTPPRVEDGGIALTGAVPQGPVPTYDELAQAYNQRVGRVRAFQAQAQIGLTYWDTQGKRRYEQADQSRVSLVMPDHLAILVRKFGVGDLFLAGSNHQASWLFDFTNPDHRVLYLQHDGQQEASSAKRKATGIDQMLALPMPVDMQDLFKLMGLSPLPLTAEAGSAVGGTVRAVAGGYLVSPSQGNWRVVIDSASKLPLRVDLLDAQGQIALTTLLSRPEQIPTPGLPPNAWPVVLSRIVFHPSQRVKHASTMALQLSVLDDPCSPELNDHYSAFDLNRLLMIYPPDEVIDLSPSPQGHVGQ